jgi:hypothetical protein
MSVLPAITLAVEITTKSMEKSNEKNIHIPL